MTVNIHIEGFDANDALQQMRHLLSAGSTTAAVPREIGGIGTTGPARDAAPKEETIKLSAKEKKAAEKAAAGKPAISTGEERTGPEDTAETVEQDAADEAVESKVDAKAETLTHDSIRGALGDYVKKFGMPAAQEDGPKLLAMVLGEKKDKSAWKISEIPDDQAALAKVLAGVVEMTAKNGFKRDAVKGK